MIREGAYIARLAFPDQSQLIALGVGQMAVNRVVDNICFCPCKPFEEWGVAVVKDLIPFLIPLQFTGPICPERFGVFNGLLVPGIVILHIGILDNLFGREVNFAFKIFFGRHKISSGEPEQNEI